jgi:ParB/RepB/Spo0J family partition protein
MSTSNNQPEVVVASIDDVEVAEGFNPRAEVAEDERFEELVASVKQNGLVTAPTVYRDNGRFVLVAGERRYRAAKKAGLKQLPLHVREKDDALAAAIAENLHREDLNPIEVARSLVDLQRVEKLKTHAEIAQRIGKSSSYVSEHLRLLALPEEAQRAIGEGTLPIGAEKVLRPIAKVSPAVAGGMVAVASKDGEGPETLVESPATVLSWLHDGIEAGEVNDPPTLIEISGYGQPIEELVGDAEKREALVQRASVAMSTLRGEPVQVSTVQLGDTEVDAARAAGCLIEVGSDWYTARYATDAELVADLVERAIEQTEREARKVERERAKAAGKKGDGSAPEPVDAGEALREQRRKEREERKRRQQQARTYNLKVGDRLRDRRGAKSRKAHALTRVKALALLVIADNRELAGCGLRLTASELQEVKVTQVKSTGEDREKVTYPEPHEVLERLVKKVEDASSVNEVLELMADALISGVLADNEELAQSRRVHWHPRVEVAGLLGAEIKEVSPRGRKRS